MRRILCVSASLGLAARVLGVAAPVGNLFQADFTQNNAGGCQYVGQANMQTVLNDCSDLAGRGQTLMTDYIGGVPEAIRLIDAFFHTGGHLNAAQAQQVQSKCHPPYARLVSRVDSLCVFLAVFNTVANWINGGGAINGGTRATPPLPWLFCHHGWLQKKQATDPAQDTAGQTYPGGNPSDIGAETRILDTQAYTDAQNRYPGSLPVS
jgi:hypothetical protein